MHFSTIHVIAGCIMIGFEFIRSVRRWTFKRPHRHGCCHWSPDLDDEQGFKDPKISKPAASLAGGSRGWTALPQQHRRCLKKEGEGGGH